MALDEKYNFHEIEAKWQAKWEEADLYHAEIDPSKPKYYGLEFFPYPSGQGLSVGHFKNYAPTDAFLRLKAMQGFNVLHPMGWDAFGQPAENEAIKRQRNPGPMVAEFAATYKRQMNLIGMGYDWDREINSSDPAYYKWTQWIFLLLYKRGLAYRQNAPVNWDPVDKTVLANEEVVNGRGWRSGALVEKKNIPQWYLKITAYADRLLYDLDKLDWSDGIKQQQRNWIGRSEGAEVRFEIAPPRIGGGGGYHRLHHSTRYPLGCDVSGAGPRTPAGRDSGDDRASRRDCGLYRPCGARDRDGSAGGRAREDRSFHGCLCHQSRQWRAGSHLDRRLCPDGLRNRRDHGSPSA